MGAFVRFVNSQGWATGSSDDDFLYRVDPSAYFFALDGNTVVGTVAAVSYDKDIGFIGYHAVRSDMRGSGIGKALMNCALSKLRPRNIGVNCLKSDMGFYEKFGFSPSYRIISYEGTAKAGSPDFTDMVSPFMIAFEKLQDYDRMIFSCDRKRFLSNWHAQPQSLLMAKYVEDRYKGYAMFRPSPAGYIIAPLICDDPSTAESLLHILEAHMPAGSKYVIDIPGANAGGLRLAEKFMMKKCNEVTRMYSPSPPPFSLDKIFSLPAAEIG